MLQSMGSQSQALNNWTTKQQQIFQIVETKTLFPHSEAQAFTVSNQFHFPQCLPHLPLPVLNNLTLVFICHHAYVPQLLCNCSLDL